MAEQEEVKTTRLTFDYFKANRCGNVARLVHTETVDVLGITPEKCFIETEDGRELHPDLEKVIYPMIKHEKHCEKSDYHTVAWEENEFPIDWFERIEETDEE